MGKLAIIIFLLLLGVVIFQNSWQQAKQEVEKEKAEKTLKKIQFENTLYLEQPDIRFQNRITIYGIVDERPIKIVFVKGKYEIELLKQGKIK